MLVPSVSTDSTGTQRKESRVTATPVPALLTGALSAIPNQSALGAIQDSFSEKKEAHAQSLILSARLSLQTTTRERTESGCAQTASQGTSSTRPESAIPVKTDSEDSAPIATRTTVLSAMKHWRCIWLQTDRAAKKLLLAMMKLSSS